MDSPSLPVIQLDKMPWYTFQKGEKPTKKNLEKILKGLNEKTFPIFFDHDINKLIGETTKTFYYDEETNSIKLKYIKFYKKK